MTLPALSPKPLLPATDPNDRFTPTALVHAPIVQAITAPDLSECRGFIRRHSKSFYFSSLLLPRSYRHEAWAIYAFCRQADDSVDGVNPGDGTVPSDAPSELAVMLRNIEGLRGRLRRVYAGRPGHGPEHAIDRAFFSVIDRTGLPSAVPERLLLGMEMDARGTHYATWNELIGYCFNVAATVGLMMTYVMGYRVPEEQRTEVMLRACDLGIAMQLTNIARDVGEDGRRGRVYLPDELLQAHGLSTAAVLAMCSQGGEAPPPLRQAVGELLEQAARHYQAARLGIPMLPPAAWLSIRSAESIYRGIGEKLAASGCDPLLGRAHVTTIGKLWRMLGAWLIGLSPKNRRLPAQATHGPADALLGKLCEQVDVL